MEKSNWKDIMIIGMFFLMVIFFVGNVNQCRRSAGFEDEAIELREYRDTAIHYKGKHGDLVSYNKSIKLENTKLTEINKDLADKIANADIKEPTKVTKIKTEYIIKEVEIPIYIKENGDTCDFEATFKKDTSYLYLSGSIDKTKMTIDSLKIPNTQHIITGYKKTGMFQKNIPVVTVQNSNPYLQVNGIEDYEVKTKKKFFEKFWFQAGVGFVAGFTLGRAVYK